MLSWKKIDKCPEEFKPVFYRRYVDDICVLFRKEEHIKLFLNYFNSCHENIKFTPEKETNNQNIKRQKPNYHFSLPKTHI